jgi:hypothetical protein
LHDLHDDPACDGPSSGDLEFRGSSRWPKTPRGGQPGEGPPESLGRNLP